MGALLGRLRRNCTATARAGGAAVLLSLGALLVWKWDEGADQSYKLYERWQSFASRSNGMPRHVDVFRKLQAKYPA